MMFRDVLVAIKPDKPIEPLVDLATSAASSSARIHLLTLLRIGLEEDEAERKETAETRLVAAASELKDVGYKASSRVDFVVAGAAHDILDIAAQVHAGLIVIGLGSRSRVGKALMGSDAQRILIESQSPVLCLPFGSL